MRVKIVGEIEFDELKRRIRRVPLMQKHINGSEIYVYEEADISVRRIHVNDVNPTTFYLLRDNIDFQRSLRRVLLEQGIDTLQLTRAYNIENEKGEVWTLMPPIIEVTQRDVIYFPRDGEIMYNDIVGLQIPIINDGAHRVSLARENGGLFTAIYITNVNKEFPFYAHPNPWERVKIVDSVPSKKGDKKYYSREDCYSLYRDFGILGCGAPRGLGS